MPNKRDPKKELCGGFYNAEIKVALMRLGTRRRKSMAWVIKQILLDFLINEKGFEFSPEVMVEFEGELPAHLQDRVTLFLAQNTNGKWKKARKAYTHHNKRVFSDKVLNVSDKVVGDGNGDVMKNELLKAK